MQTARAPSNCPYQSIDESIARESQKEKLRYLGSIVFYRNAIVLSSISDGMHPGYWSVASALLKHDSD